MLISPGVISSSKFSLDSLGRAAVPQLHPLLDIAAPGISGPLAGECTKYLNALDSCGVVRNAGNLIQTDSIIYLPIHSDLNKNKQAFISPSKVRDVNPNVTSTTRGTEYNVCDSIVYSDPKVPKGIIKFTGSKGLFQKDRSVEINPDAKKVKKLLNEQGSFLFFNYVGKGQTPKHIFSFKDLSIFYQGNGIGQIISFSGQPFPNISGINYLNSGTYLLSVRSVPAVWTAYDSFKPPSNNLFWEYELNLYFLPFGGVNVINLFSTNTTNAGQYKRINSSFLTSSDLSVEYFELDNLIKTNDTFSKLTPGYSKVNLLDKIYKVFPNIRRYYNIEQNWSGLSYIASRTLKPVTQEDISNYYSERSRSVLNKSIKDKFSKLINDSGPTTYYNEVNMDRAEFNALGILSDLNFTEESPNGYSWENYFEEKSGLIDNPYYASTRFLTNFKAGSRPGSGGGVSIDATLSNFSESSYSAFGGGTGLNSLQQIETFMKATDEICQKIRT
jgi:hypothetical protein